MLTFLHRLVHVNRTIVNNRDLLTYSRSVHSHVKDNGKEIIIPTPWGDISGKWWGSKDVQPILSIHGWEDNAGSFDRLAPLLKKSVVAIDLPGHGYSPLSPLGTTYNFVDGVTLLRHIVRHFKWQDITVIGHSYGSVLAYAYAAFFPKTVSHLIGIECMRSAITQKSEFVSNSLRDGIDLALSSEELVLKKPEVYTWGDIVDMVFKRRGKFISRENCELLLKRSTKKMGEGKYSYLRDPRLDELPLGRMTDDMLFACAPRITCKVLSIAADPGLQIANEHGYKETAKVMKKSASLFEEHTIKGNHHVHLENQETVAQIIKNFLKIA